MVISCYKRPRDVCQSVCALFQSQNVTHNRQLQRSTRKDGRRSSRSSISFKIAIFVLLLSIISKVISEGALIHYPCIQFMSVQQLTKCRKYYKSEIFFQKVVIKFLLCCSAGFEVEHYYKCVTIKSSSLVEFRNGKHSRTRKRGDIQEEN